MNSPAEPPVPSADLAERVTRLEVSVERILDELREIRIDMRAFRDEMRGEMRDIRRTAAADFRILFSASIAVALGLAGVMANGFGWI